MGSFNSWFTEKIYHWFKWYFIDDPKQGIAWSVLIIGAILFCVLYIRKLKKDRAEYLNKLYDKMEQEEKNKKK